MAGTIKFEWRGKQVSADARAGAARGLRDAGYALLNDSSALVPHETGALQATGDVTVDESALEVTISYDGPYAVRQHEDMTLSHPNGRQAKYLETPFKQNGPEYLEHVADQIRREIGG